MGSSGDDLSEQALASVINGRFGAPLRFFQSADSTNTVSLQWAAAGAPEGAVVVADHQIAGRGRRGRSWLSEPGRSLLFSLILRPKVPLDRIGTLPQAVGLACMDALEDAAGIRAEIKWPNDVTVRGRKLCGILVETRATHPRVDAVVAGVGINVHWEAHELPAEVRDRATSVAIEAARLGTPVPSRASLLSAVLSALEPWYPFMLESAGAAAVVARAAARSEILGRIVRVRLGTGEMIEGRARRLLRTGALQVEVAGQPVVVDSGEIERIRPL